MHLPSRAEIDRELAERHFAAFVRQAWPIVEPGTVYLHNWHVDAIGEHLEAVTAGEITRLIVNIPPRYMKSLQVSVLWPCWEWIRRPELRYLFASYAAELSTKHSVDRRRVLESQWYAGNWPHVDLTTDQNVKTRYENTRRGVMVATSVGGTATGLGGNRLVIDDPVNPREAYSDAKRRDANDFYDKTLATRLDDKLAGAIVLVMQRIHDDDMTGHILAKNSPEKWVHLCLPAEAPTRTVIVLPRSGREIVREQGDILWPTREGAAQLEAARAALGSRDYSAQYQQDPAPPEGAMIKNDWWRFWTPAELPPLWEELVQSWDMTFTDSAGADFVVGQVWGRVGARKYLLDQVRARADFPATLELVRGLSRKWPGAALRLVEDKANGPAVVATLARELGGFVPVTPSGGKVARLAAVSASIEAGDVYLPDPATAPWVAGFLEECARFPVGAHDDQVDAMSQALARLNQNTAAEIVVV